MTKKHDRNADITRRYAAGETLQDIGDRYGVTRERIRQIVVRAGETPRRVQTRRQHEEIAAFVRDGYKPKEAADHFGVAYAVVVKVCRDRGVPLPRYTFEDELALMRMAAMVRAGVSIRQAAGCDISRAETLRRYCRQHGIASKANTRWADLSHRAPIIERGRQEGLSWDEIADRIAEHEGRRTRGAYIYGWARSNLLSIPERGERDKPVVSRPRRVRKPRKPVPQTEPGAGWRYWSKASCQQADAFLSLHYKSDLSARDIAERLGVTREAVIGRAYRLGLGGGASA